jgi:hypothetical protein
MFCPTKYQDINKFADRAIVKCSYLLEKMSQDQVLNMVLEFGILVFEWSTGKLVSNLTRRLATKVVRTIIAPTI